MTVQVQKTNSRSPVERPLKPRTVTWNDLLGSHLQLRYRYHNDERHVNIYSCTVVHSRLIISIQYQSVCDTANRHPRRSTLVVLWQPDPVRLIIQCGAKKPGHSELTRCHYSLAVTLLSNDRFSKFLLSQTGSNKVIIKDPPHRKRVVTLPCEIHSSFWPRVANGRVYVLATRSSFINYFILLLIML